MDSSLMINTARTYGRLANSGDIEAIIAFHRRNDPEHFAPWNPELPPNFYERGFWQTRLERNMHEYHADESMRLFTFLKDSNELMATISFTNFERGPFQNCRLGYKIGKQHEGQGLMREALSGCIEHVFTKLKFHRIEANYIPHNSRSGQLLKRLGFVEHGIARQYLKINGQWQDHMLTSLINPAYS